MSAAEHGSKRHRDEEFEHPGIAGKSSQFGCRAAIEPALDTAEEFHH